MLRGTDRAVRKRSRRRGPGATSPRGDEGVTLVELLVAIVVILIILIPTAVFIIQAQKAVSAEHLQAEAINVATRQLESLQLEAAQGSLPTGTSTVTYPVAEAGSRMTDFKVTTSWTVITQGTNQSICASDADVAQQIWLVTAVVTWPKMSGASPVVQTTEIAPAQAGAVQQFAGEVAVRLTYDGTNPFLADPVTATMTAQWHGSGSRASDPRRHVQDRDCRPRPVLRPRSVTVASSFRTSTHTATRMARTSTRSRLPAIPGRRHSSPAASKRTPTRAGPSRSRFLRATRARCPLCGHRDHDTGTPAQYRYYTGPGGSCTNAPGSALSPPISPSNGVPVSVYNTL